MRIHYESKSDFIKKTKEIIKVSYLLNNKPLSHADAKRILSKALGWNSYHELSQFYKGKGRTQSTLITEIENMDLILQIDMEVGNGIIEESKIRATSSQYNINFNETLSNIKKEIAENTSPINKTEDLPIIPPAPRKAQPDTANEISETTPKNTKDTQKDKSIIKRHRTSHVFFNDTINKCIKEINIEFSDEINNSSDVCVFLCKGESNNIHNLINDKTILIDGNTKLSNVHKTFDNFMNFTLLKSTNGSKISDTWIFDGLKQLLSYISKEKARDIEDIKNLTDKSKISKYYDENQASIAHSNPRSIPYDEDDLDFLINEFENTIIQFEDYFTSEGLNLNNLDKNLVFSSNSLPQCYLYSSVLKNLQLERNLTLFIDNEFYISDETLRKINSSNNNVRKITFSTLPNVLCKKTKEAIRKSDIHILKNIDSGTEYLYDLSDILEIPQAEFLSLDKPTSILIYTGNIEKY